MSKDTVAIDRIGTNADSYTLTDEGRIPVFDAVYRRQMIKDLYVIGWSYRLIAQALTVGEDAVRLALFEDELPERKD